MTYFNPHSPRREWLASISDICYNNSNFNPHSPRREWHDSSSSFNMSAAFQSTLSSQRVTMVQMTGQVDLPISIHTLLAESDDIRDSSSNFPHTFQSTLSSQRVTESFHCTHNNRLFQSTLSSQRVTSAVLEGTMHCDDFNPHSPRREWQS